MKDTNKVNCKNSIDWQGYVEKKEQYQTERTSPQYTYSVRPNKY